MYDITETISKYCVITEEYSGHIVQKKSLNRENIRKVDRLENKELKKMIKKLQDKLAKRDNKITEITGFYEKKIKKLKSKIKNSESYVDKLEKKYESEKKTYKTKIQKILTLICSNKKK